ncbi:EAL domain-containing protein [Psychromonas sp. 14N.309.X.WAT.B.A12]|uniref:EAL domain-containing protein n=1 Tax=Psychromonas sp. 14N.309.X.WAT.B.A12 TaxID=2998322 RepID=UPI0025B1C5F7|nr:EAL domain-containing protein [Psychromonas sp. 14N.309.X.WAT.B.A12]MDN2661771.1 EAL domain-containing protein [Psychromonas sp. 14N.309.X.WAT.B.A12]
MEYFQTLKSRLLFLVFLVSLPGIIAIFFQAASERSTAIETARLSAVTVADNITAEQIKILQKTESFLKRLSKYSILLTPNSPQCSAFLANLHHLTDYYVNLGAPDVNGDLTCTALPLAKTVNVADRPYIQQAISNREFTVGKFQVDRVANTTSINFAYPIVDQENNVAGVAVAAVSLEWWSLQLEHANLPQNAVAYITDHQDNILALYPENKAQLGLPISEVQHFWQSAFNTHTKMIEDNDGELRIFVSKELMNIEGDMPVNMVIGIPFEEALHSIDIRLLKIISTILFFIVLCIVLAIVAINRSILKPLKALKTSTQQLALGNSSDVSSLGGAIELVDLQKHFSRMAKTRLDTEQALKHSQHFLQQSEDKLSRHLQNTPLASIGWNKEFICTEWNRAAEVIFGYSAVQALGSHIMSLIVAPELREEFTNYYHLLFEKIGGTFFRGANVTKNGDVIFCNWHNTLILDDKNDITGVAALIKDVTEDKRNQDTLDRFFKLPLNLHIILDFEGTVIKVNNGWSDILGFSAEELIGTCIVDKIHPDDREKTALEIQRIGNGGDVFSFENRYCNKSGEHRIISWSSTASMDDQLIYAIGIDITERRINEDKLRLAAGVFTHAKEAIVISDDKNKIIDINEAFTNLSGYSEEETIGKRNNILKSGLHDQDFYQVMRDSLTNKGFWAGEIWNKHKDGTIIPQLLTISTVYGDPGKIKNYIALYTDITDLKNQQKQLEHIAHYDVLTGLPNRSLLADRLKQAMINCDVNNKSLAVVFLDLDGFKVVNDSYGHSTGDQLLVKAASLIQGSMRSGDTLARFGGDEFVAVFANLEKAKDCEPLLEGMLAALDQPVVIDGARLKVSASMGVTIYPHDGVSADQLLRHADQAMYIAKQEGKNRYYLFDMEQDIALKSQHEQLLRISEALQNDEFVLYYQPKVNMKTGELVGAEALIRWQHPERGLLPPIEFLPVINRHQLNIQLGEWVIESALSQIALWRRQGVDIVVSVNIDAQQLQQKTFAERLGELLQIHGDVPPHLLQLEVLETSELQDIENVTNIMQACTNLGVGFALDDFGTGYCSLTYLKRLPVNLIKIDQSFILGMLDDPDDLSIVEGVLGLSKAFQRNVIAEGVETLAHGVALLRLGCCYAQGYGIARPMPAEEMLPWAKNWKPDLTWSEVVIDKLDSTKE